MDPLNPPAPVAVIGDALLDITVRPSEPMRPGGDVPAAISLASGGQGANVAVRLARRGVQVRLACGLGTDAAAGLIRGALEADGVRIHDVPVAATGAVVILVSDDGERAMLSRRAAFHADIDVAELTSEVAWTVVSGYGITDPGAAAVLRGLATRPGRRALLGCAVSTAERPAWIDAARTLRPDLVILNEAEANALDPAATLGTPLVLVTSPDGVTVRSGGAAAVRIEGPSVEAVDATGAGDAFAAAVIAGLLDPSGDAPWPPAREVLQAVVAAALAVAADVVAEVGAQARISAERAGALA